MSPRSNKLLYEGKAKIIYEGPEPGTVIQYFKDDTTAGNGEKKAVLAGKGILNNRISEYIMTCLEEIGINTHFIKSLNMREQLVKAVEIIPVEVVVRNLTAGSIATRFGVEEGMVLPRPLVEYYLKSDKLNDPMVTQEHITSFDWAAKEELQEMHSIALRTNDFLCGLFLGAGIKLVDLKLEFGRVYDEDGNLYIILADEISPDSCRLWDVKTGEKLDKDRFRRNLGGVEEAYQEVARRLGVLMDNKPTKSKTSNEKAAVKKSSKSKSSGKKKAASTEKTKTKKKSNKNKGKPSAAKKNIANSNKNQADKNKPTKGK